jgi:phage terminase large subunit
MRAEAVVKTVNGIYLSQKAWDVLNDDSLYISLEGTTGSLKSITADRVFMKRVYQTNTMQTQFAMVGTSVDTLERNVIDNPLSFFNKHMYVKKDGKSYKVMRYMKAGKGGARIEWKTPHGMKRIYFAGFDNKARYKKILGMTLYGIWADEIQTAHDDFVAEMFTRLARDKGFLVTTSNGGLPDQKIYTDYLNKGRPSAKYWNTIPQPTMQDLLAKKQDERFRFYWFGFEDNPMMEQAQIDYLNDTHPAGSFEHNSKILGIRGFVEGTIYAKYLSVEKNMHQFNDVYRNPESKFQFGKYTIGVDIGSTDFTVFTLVGFTYDMRYAVALDKIEINHASVDDIWEAFYTWFDKYMYELGGKVFGMFIDSAAQIVKTSLQPKLMMRYGMSIADSYKFTIKERVDWGIRFIHQGRLGFTEYTKDTYDAFKNTLYKKNLHETDIREFPNHIYKDRIDSLEYAITPFIKEMLRVV